VFKSEDRIIYFSAAYRT